MITRDIIWGMKKSVIENKDLKGYFDRLGVKQITTLATSHTHCSYLLPNDVSIHYISKRLGHKRSKVTLEVYSHL
ncbi:hypothetical protein GCM10010896_14060 [Mammaliicoccus stepanovicii]|nr:hypothetical protein GCM10010896_14060 [Mammaliicoccus stepanovicii]